MAPRSRKTDMKCVSSTPVSEYALGMRSYFSIALACAFAAFSVLLQPAIGAEIDSGNRNYFEELKQKAKAGDDAAQIILGFAYQLGGDFSYQGESVIQDHNESFKWYLMAAEQGNPAAQYSIGNSYSLGTGVTQDSKESVNWFRKAAEQGDDFSQAILGFAYFKGDGVIQDYKESVKWFRKAAEQGDSMAQTRLGLAYYLGGIGVTQDLKEATKWFRKAAERGYADAQNMLGLSYSLGKGVIQDFVQAHAWFNVASANGFSSASESRDELAKKMNPEQIGKAQELAKEYFEKYQPEK